MDSNDVAELSSVHICTDRFLTGAFAAKAASAAIEERADNLVVPSRASGSLEMFARGARSIPQPVSARMALVTKKLWRPGRKLKVKFMEKPSSFIGDQIETYAAEWMNHANIDFVFTTARRRADIRISFDRAGGSWSYLGTDAGEIPTSQATMNYGWLDDNTSDEEFSRVILHEFGHALGAIHEHSHPEGDIPWNKPAVYAYYHRTNGWNKAETDAQVFDVYSMDQVNADRYDPESIMHYAIPPALLLPGAAPVPWNTRLSANDRSFIRMQYADGA